MTFVLDSSVARKRPKRRYQAMADNVNRIAERLGAKVVARVPDAGGGAFGAARLA